MAVMAKHFDNGSAEDNGRTCRNDVATNDSSVEVRTDSVSDSGVHDADDAVMDAIESMYGTPDDDGGHDEPSNNTGTGQYRSNADYADGGMRHSDTGENDDIRERALSKFGFMDDVPLRNPLEFIPNTTTKGTWGEMVAGNAMFFLCSIAFIACCVFSNNATVMMSHDSTVATRICAGLAICFIIISLMASGSIAGIYNREPPDYGWEYDRIRATDDGSLDVYDYRWSYSYPEGFCIHDSTGIGNTGGIRELRDLVNDAKSKCDINFVYLCRNLNGYPLIGEIMSTIADKRFQDDDIDGLVSDADKIDDDSFNGTITQYVNLLKSTINKEMSSPEYNEYEKIRNSLLSKNINGWIDLMEGGDDSVYGLDCLRSNIENEIHRKHDLGSMMDSLSRYGFIRKSIMDTVSSSNQYSIQERHMLSACRKIGCLKASIIASTFLSCLLMAIMEYLVFFLTNVPSLFSHGVLIGFVLSGAILSVSLLAFVVGVFLNTSFITCFVDYWHPLFDKPEFFKLHHMECPYSNSGGEYCHISQIVWDSSNLQKRDLADIRIDDFNRHDIECFLYTLFSIDHIAKSCPAGKPDDSTKARLFKVLSYLSMPIIGYMMRRHRWKS